jgi:nucleotide-binding universal stress UspA family protein
MSRIKKIMVAVDFSVYSVKIAKYARGIAEDLKANLVFVNVINKRDINAFKQAFGYHSENLSVDDYIGRLKRERTEKMQRLIEKTSCANITHRLVIRTGIPFLELINAAEEEQVDIVIMGAKGRSDLAGILSGSTAEKMFRRCPVPLLSLRERDHQRRGAPLFRPLYLFDTNSLKNTTES